MFFPLIQQRDVQADILLKAWDTGLFLIVFPFLSFTAYPYLLAIIVWNCFIIAHMWIVYERYIHNSEIRWPLWTEWCAVMGGVLLLLAPFTNGCGLIIWRTFVLILTGQIISYGHLRKILQSDKEYYFELDLSGGSELAPEHEPKQDPENIDVIPEV